MPSSKPRHQTIAAVTEPIVIRNSVCYAERLYASSRGDYIAYRYKGKLYVVRIPESERRALAGAVSP